MNKRYIIILCAVVIIIGLYIGMNIGNTISPSAVSTANNVTYYCQEGAIQARYASSSVALSLSDGMNMTLPQAVSGSGIRYAFASTTFWSEGDNASLMQGNTAIYSNCISGTESNVNATTTSFINASKLFAFNFPNQFSLYGDAGGYSQDWAEESTSSGMLLAEVYIPKSFMPKTNFGEAKFTVGVSSDLDAIADCLVATYGGGETKTNVSVNGVAFTKFHFTDVGAGQYYDITSFRTVRDNACYAVEYSIHSGNIDNYDPSQGITAFDEANVQMVLDGIAQSFRFL